MNFFEADKDYEVGKVLKYKKPNPVGEDMYLRHDGSIESDEVKIVKVQRIFKENYYKAGGPWVQNFLQKNELRKAQGEIGPF